MYRSTVRQNSQTFRGNTSPDVRRLWDKDINRRLPRPWLWRMSFRGCCATCAGFYLRLTFLAHRFLSPWWWRRYVLPKRRFLQQPHGVISQKTTFLEYVNNLEYQLLWIRTVWNKSTFPRCKTAEKEQLNLSRGAGIDLYFPGLNIILSIMIRV
jgi:hypothetical protein